MRIRTNQNTLWQSSRSLSPMISIFHLSLKNSQRYDHDKKNSKRCVDFFVSNCIYNFNNQNHHLKKKIFMRGNIFLLLGVYIVGDKKNGVPFGTFFATIISLWVFETQMKNWYHWREEILNFIIMFLVCSYSHLFERYRCLSENSTLFSQSRLIHFLTSFFKNFLFVQSFSE